MRALSVVALLMAATLALGCTKIAQFNRFFLSQCAEDGPNPETGFDIVLQPVDIADYSERLREAAHGFSVSVIAEVPYKGEAWPIYHASQLGPDRGRRLLIVAGMHGNEIAGSLAAPDILSDIREHSEIYGSLDLHLIAPSNPVGLMHGARYNAQGCDINRDFSEFETVEARAIRDVIVETSPDLILSLHEGPHDGFFVIATRSTSAVFATAVATELQSAGVGLATHSNLGSRLRDPGVMTEGWFITGAKSVLRIQSLGAFAHRRSIPLLTTEGPWGEADVASRVRAQVLAVRAAASKLVLGVASESQ